MPFNYEQHFKRAKAASKQLALLSDSDIIKILNRAANAIAANTPFLLRENHRDLSRLSPTDPRFDRLQLTGARLSLIVEDMRNVSALTSPLNRLICEEVRPNGLRIARKTCPMGVVGVIYESRPNVTLDLFSLCLKSGNAVVLKGGSDAEYSNKAIVSVLHNALTDSGLDQAILTLLPAERAASHELLRARDYIDLLVPRGGRKLIDFVREYSKIPMIETGAGVCHTYFDKDGDIEIARKVINNAKTRRVGVCNALDCLLVHRSRMKELPYLVDLLSLNDVVIYADIASYRALCGKYPKQILFPASPESFGTEFLSYKMALKCVTSLEDALSHIETYGSKHSEAIISQNKTAIDKFFTGVDASTLYSNASTAFTDGAQFGLGAEVGTSTQKLHARGPMALEALTTYKWLVEGDGQIRP